MRTSVAIAVGFVAGAWSIIPAAIAVGFAFAALTSEETPLNHFSTFAQAQQERMFDKGWIPDFIPKDATEIYVQEDMDLNTAYGLFTSNNAASVREHCVVRSSSPAVLENASQWFPEDPRSGARKRLSARGFQTAVCDDGKWVVAISACDDTVFFWTR
jgi:hypothetical protein